MANWEKSREALVGMVQESAQQNIITLQALSEPRKPRYINRELKSMENMRWVGEPLLTYQRCDASMEDADVREALGLKTAPERRIKQITKGMLQLDNASRQNLDNLYLLGLAAGVPNKEGRGGIEMADFPDVFRI
jgi:hypothetical protein